MLWTIGPGQESAQKPTLRRPPGLLQAGSAASLFRAGPGSAAGLSYAALPPRPCSSRAIRIRASFSAKSFGAAACFCCAAASRSCHDFLASSPEVSPVERSCSRRAAMSFNASLMVPEPAPVLVHPGPSLFSRTLRAMPAICSARSLSEGSCGSSRGPCRVLSTVAGGRRLQARVPGCLWVNVVVLDSG